MTKKPILFTGITPSGDLTIAHYCAVIHYLLAVQEEYEIILMIADLHALTVPKANFDYQQKCREMAALFYACGLRKENCKIFIQSQISEHVELFYLLSSHVSVGLLNTMIQYKEKQKAGGSNLSLWSYPVLMAADILLYRADLIVVGEDQTQHLELTSKIARKFNNFAKSNILKMPKFLIPTQGARIMSLKDPAKKMSKTDEVGCIKLMDNMESIAKKIGQAETDSENKVYYNPEKKPGISNLIEIYAQFTNKKRKEVEDEVGNLDYYQFKQKVVATLQKELNIIQSKYAECLNSIESTLYSNSTSLKLLATKTVKTVKERLKLMAIR